MADLDDLVLDFLAESREGLDQLDRDLVALEGRADDRELLGRIFRCAHTIKGTCGFLEFRRLEVVAHAGENLLSRLRDGQLALTEAITTGLLAMVDAIRAMLGEIEATGRDGDDDFAALRAQLAALLEHGGVAPVLAAHGPSATPAGAGASAPNDSLRVNVALLDQLMDLVGELVLARNEIRQHSRQSADAARTASSQRLDLITTQLQEGVMRTRMQPIDSVFSKLPRLVRDLAKGLGKQVRLEMSGGQTELDKTLIEVIKDPLMHLLRNAIDHGIERPELRRERGKPEEGRVALRASHAGGRVVIELSDDGGGMDAETLKAKAIDKRLISPLDAERMTERQLLELVFLPGFSTAQIVSNVSGRGVGMDVVRTNVEGIGGEIEIQSAHGRGTTFRIRIPLTLAIVPALIVASDGDRYAIPQANLLEVVRLDDEAEHARVEDLGGAPVHRLRGRLLPLVYLRQVLGSAQPSESADVALNIVVLQCEADRFGLVVDRVIDSQEIVAKPLGLQVKSIDEFSGATILGDGRVALILDISGIARRVRVLAERERALADREDAHATNAAARERLLLVSRSDGGRLLIPLEHVVRLERVPRAALESESGNEVIQYHGEILPLAWVEDLLPDRRSGRRVVEGRPEREPSDALCVVVVRAHEARLGLVIGEILDVVEREVAIERRAIRPGVLGSLILDRRVTEILDMPWVLEHSGHRECVSTLEAIPA